MPDLQDRPDTNRRKFLKMSAAATTGAAAFAGTAAAGGKKKKKKRRKKRRTKAGWGLIRKGGGMKGGKWGKYKYFKVLYKTSPRKFPAGCGKRSRKKKYQGYKVKLMGGGNNFNAQGGNSGGKKMTIYVRKNRHLKGLYRIRKLKRCGKNKRIYFKAARKKKKPW